MKERLLSKLSQSYGSDRISNAFYRSNLKTITPFMFKIVFEVREVNKSLSHCVFKKYLFFLYDVKDRFRSLSHTILQTCLRKMAVQFRIHRTAFSGSHTFALEHFSPWIPYYLAYVFSSEGGAEADKR